MFRALGANSMLKLRDFLLHFWSTEPKRWATKNRVGTEVPPGYAELIDQATLAIAWQT